MRKILFLSGLILLLFGLFPKGIFAQSIPLGGYTCCQTSSQCGSGQECGSPKGGTPFGTCANTAGKVCIIPPASGESGDECNDNSDCADGYKCVSNGPLKACIKDVQPSSRNSTNTTAANGEEDVDLKCNGQNGINTAIGCVPINDTNSFIAFILRWAIGIGGGIAFLLVLLAGFQIMTSSGDPDRLKAGQELLTSAIAGLIMLIFSVFILRVIGVDILKIPGLV